ncbi:hypothetical protein CIHG_07847 [Coccidioides immitis H538.4]|uniref:Uncharacterized protein n=3 Tax=Coccidioides immitis TaxID=5501 RepID=A0A0J8QUP4_COCIT|nr:hypothetical protein CIRG_05668 [Coccidioides immitis RMSCC 2394]KMU76579.1 hypothetical protein CISG_05722 [Coccidioides immitis RMSCC 3703]KMU89814.1 hypothetical protein CIHG_07847 [Coccidioides immitis H538.4]
MLITRTRRYLNGRTLASDVAIHFAEFSKVDQSGGFNSKSGPNSGMWDGERRHTTPYFVGSTCFSRGDAAKQVCGDVESTSDMDSSFERTHKRNLMRCGWKLGPAPTSASQDNCARVLGNNPPEDVESSHISQK